MNHRSLEIKINWRRKIVNLRKRRLYDSYFKCLILEDSSSGIEETVCNLVGQALTYENSTYTSKHSSAFLLKRGLNRRRRKLQNVATRYSSQLSTKNAFEVILFHKMMRMSFFRRLIVTRRIYWLCWSTTFTQYED